MKSQFSKAIDHIAQPQVENANIIVMLTWYLSNERTPSRTQNNPEKKVQKVPIITGINSIT